MAENAASAENGLGLTTAPITNPAPRATWPVSLAVDPDMAEGPAPWSMEPCGCHLRRPDYEAVLCLDHLAELNAPTRVLPPGGPDAVG